MKWIVGSASALALGAVFFLGVLDDEPVTPPPTYDPSLTMEECLEQGREYAESLDRDEGYMIMCGEPDLFTEQRGDR